MCSNNNCIQQCNCTQPCNCACSCSPEPCIEGCLTDTKTDCVFLSQDLDICSEVLEKGSTVTEALAKLGEAVCDGITVTVQDMKVKVDANDTTTGYLFDKLTVCDNLTKTVTNINGNETLRLCTKIDTISGSGDNILTSGPNGLYVPPASLTGYNLTPLFSNSVLLTVNPVLGGQSILATVKRDIVSGGGDNILQIGANGLYVPPPSTIAQTIVNRINIPNSGIESFVTVAANLYTVSSKIVIDPSSTAPISLTAAGLKVDCCAPAASPNTPISIVLPSDSCLNMTATGIDSHTVTASVKVDTVSGGNALVKGPNGLYCPAPGAAAATTINDTPTVDATLVSPGVYTLAVGKSIDSCNALVLGSDSKLYVNGVVEPYNLNFIRTVPVGLGVGNIIFEFQGPTTTSTDYEVEVFGTFGSPTTWVPISFSGLVGNFLQYIVSSVPQALNVLKARVRYKCGSPANYSDWVGLAYNQQFTLTSEDGSISVTPGTSGIKNEWNIQVGDSGAGYDTWTAIPNSMFLNSTTAGPDGAYYKISNDKKSIYFRGSIAISVTAIAGATVSLAKDVITLAPLLGLLSPSINLALIDKYSTILGVDYSIDTKYIGMSRTNNIFSTNGTYTNTTLGTTITVECFISSISVH